MSRKHPIVSITGSSGAGTSTVTTTFTQIFRREGINAAILEGDAFHRYNRIDMRALLKEAGEHGNHHVSHFGPEANLFDNSPLSLNVPQFLSRLAEFDPAHGSNPQELQQDQQQRKRRKR